MRYLAFAPLAYALDIMRPLQAEARRRGDEFKWVAHGDVGEQLAKDEIRLVSDEEVAQFNPDAVFSPVDWLPYNYPGIKVMVFHGFDTNKRDNDVHFRIRGWYDLFLTQGPSTTSRFQALAHKHGYFDVQETGWAKLDPLFDLSVKPLPTPTGKPVILYASTFTPSVCSIPLLSPEVDKLLSKRDWHWLLTTHPKTTPAHAEQLIDLARRYDNAEYVLPNSLIPVLKAADVIVCDTSSIIFEFILQQRPAVTFRNHLAGPHLIDIQEVGELEAAIDMALSRPPELMSAINEYGNHLHPYRDGCSSARCLDAVMHHIQYFQARSKKPFNLLRKWRLKKRIRRMSRNG